MHACSSEIEHDPDTLTDMVNAWLSAFERALAGGRAADLESLFLADGYWRDLLAFTGTLTTVRRQGNIARVLLQQADYARARSFEVDADRTSPRRVTRAGVDNVEAIFRFDTVLGRGEGVVRLTPDPHDRNRLCAWTFMTALNALHLVEERTGARRPTGEAYAREFHGPNWLDQRNAARAFADREPAVLVVGGGQAGLSIAARLGQLGIDTLVVERHARIGDNWRKRYHSLTLHNQVHVNHLPYMPFPPNWPVYIPKDKLANWFEAYAEAMELNFWTSTEFSGASYDERTATWRAKLSFADGGERVISPRHIVMAGGVSAIPNMPDLPGLDDFAGEVVHSQNYGDADERGIRHAIVVGTGNSGHDVAQDLHAAGVKVTLVQRSPTLVVSVEPSAQIPYALYDEGPSLEDCDLIVTGTPFPIVRKAHIQMTERCEEIDRELLDALRRKGFRMDTGDDGSGWQFKYLTRGGGYYFNVGCSDLIANGEIALLQYRDIDRFVAHGAVLNSGEIAPAELVVLATGYAGQDVLARKLFGDDIADRLGPVWGFGEGDELRNMFTRTAQPGLWFMAGSFAQCRIYSRYLALQIAAQEHDALAATALTRC